MKLIFFPDQSDLREWFEKNHNKETELSIGYYKVGTGKPSVTWSQSVDEALCFGWIDGIRKSIDENSYTIRFTPRKQKSIWSVVNIAKIQELIKLGLMKPEGIAAFEKRSEERSGIYSFEQKGIQLDKHFEKDFKANEKAWKFFQSQPPSYQKPAIWWVMSAKQQATRLNRFNTLIDDSEAGKRIKQLRRQD